MAYIALVSPTRRGRPVEIRKGKYALVGLCRKSALSGPGRVRVQGTRAPAAGNRQDQPLAREPVDQLRGHGQERCCRTASGPVIEGGRPGAACTASAPPAWVCSRPAWPTLGLAVPVLSSLSRNHNNQLAKCGCKKHCIDFLSRRPHSSVHCSLKCNQGA